jgi:hypothetical protein
MCSRGSAWEDLAARRAAAGVKRCTSAVGGAEARVARGCEPGAHLDGASRGQRACTDQVWVCPRKADAMSVLRGGRAERSDIQVRHPPSSSVVEKRSHPMLRHASDMDSTCTRQASRSASAPSDPAARRRRRSPLLLPSLRPASAGWAVMSTPLAFPRRVPAWSPRPPARSPSHSTARISRPSQLSKMHGLMSVS